MVLQYVAEAVSMMADRKQRKGHTRSGQGKI
jgi:hypothetical protein